MTDNYQRFHFIYFDAVKLMFLAIFLAWSTHSKASGEIEKTENIDEYTHSSTIDISNINGQLELNTQLQIFQDESNQMTISEIIDTPEATIFKPFDVNSKFGFSDSAYWLKFSISNSSMKTKHLVLLQNYPLIDSIDFWVVVNGEVNKHIKTGDREVFSSRELDQKDFMFNLAVEPSNSQDIYLRFQSSGPINIGMSLNQNAYLLSKISGEQLLFGGYYGGFLVLAIYNMFLFFAAREKAFIHYLWYLLSYGVYMSTHNGYAFQYLWPNNPWLANQSLLILLSLSLFWGLKFSQEILNSPQFSPMLNNSGVWLQRISVVCLISSFVLPYSLMIYSLSLLTIFVCLLILSIGIISLLAKYKPAIYFMLAWTTLLFAVLIYMLKTFGFLPHNGYTQNAFQIASLLEMTLLSVALSYHFNELKKKSYTDALTFLYNRRHFDDRFHQEFEQAQLHSKSLSLLMMDIDYFKKYNDRFGHAEGDKIIQFVASVLKDTVRKPLLPCRYGGEEFVIILPRTTKSAALVLAERLREKIALDSEMLNGITVSIGVASIEDIESGGHCLDAPDRLFQAADTALYQAKEKGRNRVEDYASKPQLSENDLQLQ